MKILTLTTAFVLLFQVSFAQSIDKIVDGSEAETHLRYLASDELMGRDTGSPGIDTAAQYIVDQFEKYGVAKIEGRESYFQEVPLLKTNIPSKGKLDFLNVSLVHGENALILRGTDTTARFPAVYAHYGLEEDVKGLDIEGKIVVAKFGFPGITNTRDGFKTSREKRKMLSEKGALGVIELYNSTQINWPLLVMYINRASMIIDNRSNSEFSRPFHILINDTEEAYTKKLGKKKIKQVGLEVSGLTPIPVKGKNVIGYIEGTDPELKKEYLLLTAHYDHVGHDRASFKGGVPQDSIYNGARDNALGMTALLMAAKYFGKVKPRRSIIFLFVTAEEKGLLGSEYYVEHPWVPLNRCIFNLNVDCAGYNDTTKTTIFGLYRNTASDHLTSASKKYGLQAIGDPIPEQNIFERSDQFNFAKKGIPSVLFGPGVTAFDEKIQKYYHQLNDHAETLNYNYLTKVYKAFIKSAESIANDTEAPRWTEGDKYEKAAKELYK